MIQGFFRDPNVVSSLPTQFGAEALLGTSQTACHHRPQETDLMCSAESQPGGRCLMRVRVCVSTVDKPVVSVEVEPVPCTEVSMELFDPIFSCGVLRPSGHVVKCFHDDHPDYDELRQVSAPPPPARPSVFTHADRVCV